MFCPRCKIEYEAGLDECADCGVPLVGELPSLEIEDDDELAEVLATHNQGDIAIIKSILDNYEIEYHFYDEYFSLVRPAVQPARLMVRKKDIKKVVHILHGLDLNYQVIALNKSSKNGKTQKEKKKILRDIDFDKEQGKIAFCMECKKPFIIAKRYMDTNLCEDCFNKDTT